MKTVIISILIGIAAGIGAGLANHFGYKLGYKAGSVMRTYDMATDWPVGRACDGTIYEQDGGRIKIMLEINNED